MSPDVAKSAMLLGFFAVVTPYFLGYGIAIGRKLINGVARF
tara:strand:+ start:140 stop:262 length:123 start_codon:yes stop_codon:yes gene_type:complete